MIKSIHYFLGLANIIGFLGMVTMNYLANALPLNGKTTGELSAQYPNLFVPAGFTFAIWGIIYLLLSFFVVYQTLGIFRAGQEEIQALERIQGWFFLSCLFNAGWILAWHYQKTGASLLIMLGLFLCLLFLYLRLGIGKENVSGSTRYLVHLPFSIYLGWISVASIANVTVYLIHTGWNRFGIGDEYWTLILLAVAILLAFLMLFIRRDVFYALVIAWALFGIWRKQSPAPVHPLVTHTALIGLILILLGILSSVFLFKWKNHS